MRKPPKNVVLNSMVTGPKAMTQLYPRASSGYVTVAEVVKHSCPILVDDVKQFPGLVKSNCLCLTIIQINDV